MAFLTGSFAFTVFHVNIGENSIVMIIRLLEKVFCTPAVSISGLPLSDIEVLSLGRSGQFQYLYNSSLTTWTKARLSLTLNVLAALPEDMP